MVESRVLYQKQNDAIIVYRCTCVIMDYELDKNTKELKNRLVEYITTNDDNTINDKSQSNK